MVSAEPTDKNQPEVLGSCLILQLEILYSYFSVITTCKTTSPKYKEHKQGKNAMTCLQANKTHTTLIQNQEEPQKIQRYKRHIYTKLLQPDKR
jgi:hypothetical protein